LEAGSPSVAQAAIATPAENTIETIEIPVDIKYFL
jgi:hypothetical protein